MGRWAICYNFKMSVFLTYLLIKFVVACVMAFIAGFMGWID